MKRTIRLFLLPAVVFTFFAQSLSADEDAAKAQKLVDRAIKAMGGAKALAKTRHTIIEDEGTYYGMGDGVPYQGRYVYVFGNPGRFRMEILGQFLSVTDGDKSWMSVMRRASVSYSVALDGKRITFLRTTSLCGLKGRRRTPLTVTLSWYETTPCVKTASCVCWVGSS